jgi:glycosyltransferase involved in cell wall biosynthesis
MTRLKIHTVDQPESDITTFVLSCNRLHLLEKTLSSFLNTCEEKTKMVILDDSGDASVYDNLVSKYGDFCDIICFPENRGQWWALDFMVSYCYTDYIFYVEDDWEFLSSGYLKQSRQILHSYRNVGNVDISQRTFESGGYDTYYDELFDNSFYFKKPWRVSDKHLFWVGWVGSPNLKRRDDLILLGRVEKWHNEWNIDRRFHALGFRSVYLKDKYVEHLGDAESKMDGKRPPDWSTPEDYFPELVKPERIYPKFDYFHLENSLK